MKWLDLREGWFRMAGLWRRRQYERELTEELEFHLAMKEQKYSESERGAYQASRQAKLDFGGFEKWKEVCRDVGRWRLVEDFGRDLALAARMLRRTPVFTAVAVLILTLAIGVNTAIFSLMNTVMLKALPVPTAEKLAILRIQPDKFGYAFSYPVFQQLEAQSRSVMETFAFTGTTLQLRGSEGVENVAGELVSGQFFKALGVRPKLGRWITPRDDRPGAPDGMSVVVSNHFWRSRMSADPQAVGQKIRLSQGVFTVIGVMPDGFRGMQPDARPDVFIPFQLEPFVDAPFNNIASGYRNWWFQVGGHLKDGVSLEQVNAFLDATSHRFFERVSPGVNFRLNGHLLKELYLTAEPGANGFSILRLRFLKPLRVLMGLVAIVLLIACLNLATLLTARAASRVREITTRFALGANRGRLMRQLLTESLLLALSGTVLGLALSPAITHFLAAMLAPRNSQQAVVLDVSPDLTVFAFAALMAIVTTVLIGTLPALRSTSSGMHTALREGSAALRSVERRHLWPRILLSVEVALSLVLVTGAGLLGYSLVKLHQTPVGFEAEGLVYMPVDMSKQARKGQALAAAYREVVSEIEKLPGVQAASTTAIIPLSMNWMSADVKVPGGRAGEVFRNTVGPDYFRSMRTPLLEGREFRWTDNGKSGKKAVLNQAAVKLLFPNGGALGQEITFDDGKTLTEVAGVAADAKYTTMRDAAPPTIYTPVTEDIQPGSSFTLLMRISGASAPLVTAAGKAVRHIVPDIPAPVAFSMAETVAESLASERIMAVLALFFGGLGLLTTGIGLYGTLAYATERRTGEIGIRLALGARPKNVIAMVCGENGAIALFGCGMGIAGSVAASRVIGSFLFGVSAHDPFVLGAAAIVLLCVAAAASLGPAMKAARIDPLAAIRYE